MIYELGKLTKNPLPNASANKAQHGHVGVNSFAVNNFQKNFIKLNLLEKQ